MYSVLCVRNPYLVLSIRSVDSVYFVVKFVGFRWTLCFQGDPLLRFLTTETTEH